MTVLQDMLANLPAEMLCSALKKTRTIISSVIEQEIKNVAPKKSTPKAKKISSTSSKE
jgi:hypothetical protein